MRCVCIFFHRYSNEYDINWKLKILVNQVWWNMFISFTGWNHWQHCMNNKLNTTKWYAWLFYLLLIQSHLYRRKYYWLNDIRYTWPKYHSLKQFIKIIVLGNDLYQCIVWILTDTNWYSLNSTVNQQICIVLYISPWRYI